MKGWALGLNAAGGNIGVSSVQLLTPILMGIGLINLYQATPVGGVYLQNAGLMWVLPLAIAVFGAVAFLGPLVGSLARPLGGLLADKVGGAIVTFWNFIAMAAATIGVLYFVGAKDFTGFLVMFLILFVTTGVGNGSTYRMIPSIFREENLRKVRGKGDAARAMALKTASIESGAALGFIGAIGACGGYLIPSGFGKSIAMTGGPQLALIIYLAFYAACLALTWWYYLRRPVGAAGASSLAQARV